MANRICALLIGMAVFMFPGFAYADDYFSDLDYMEDVYQYDLYQPEARPGVQQPLQYGTAVRFVTSLGLMTFSDGEDFGEGELVTAANLQAVFAAAYETEDAAGIAGLSEWEPDKVMLSKEVVQILVRELGYTMLEADDWQQHWNTAVRIGMLNHLQLEAEEPISRGELAQLLYNFANSSILRQTAAGTSDTYHKDTETTWLSERMGIISIEGLLSATPSINLYSDVLPGKDEVEIDRVRYRFTDPDIKNLLGRRVEAYVKKGQDDMTVLTASQSGDNNTLSLDCADIAQISENRITYDQTVESGDVQQKKVTLQTGYTLLHNGRRTNERLHMDMLGREGKLLLSDADGDGTFDVVLLFSYQSYVVNKTDADMERIFLKYNAQFFGQPFVDIKPYDKKTCEILLDGSEITLQDIAPNSVVSVAEHADYLRIVVSNNTVAGEIAEISNDKFQIADVWYPAADSYVEAVSRGESGTGKLELGARGTFYLSESGAIAGFDSGISQYTMGYLSKVASQRGIDFACMLRIFDETGVWSSYPLADRVTLDGIANTDVQTAYEKLQAAVDDGMLVRFQLNKSNEVIFLDTPETGINELSDTDRVRSDYTWTGTLDWRLGMRLEGTPYKITKASKIFVVPPDINAEEEFIVTDSSSLMDGQKADFDLYNIDDFLRPVYVVSRQEMAQRAIERVGLIVDQVRVTLGEDGDFCYKLTGVRTLSITAGQGGVTNVELYTTSKVYHDHPGIKTGNIYRYSLNNNGDINYLVPVFTDAGQVHGEQQYPPMDDSNLNYDRIVGTVTHISPQDMMVAYTINGEKQSMMLRSIAIYYDKPKGVVSATIRDINPGDRIFLMAVSPHCDIALILRD